MTNGMRSPLMATLIPLLVFISSCQADADFLGDIVKPFISASEIYDSNIFRVKDRSDPILGGDKQLYDFITTVTVGTKIHYSISQAELNLLFKEDFFIYEHYTRENKDQTDVNGNLSLTFFDKVKMNIYGEYQTVPEDRVDYRSSARNDSTMSMYGASLGYETPTGIGFEAAYRRMGIDYSLAQFNTNLFSVDTFTGTMSYKLSEEARLYAAYQRDDTNYNVDTLINSTPVDNSNVADSFRIGLDKTVSPKTAISCYIGYLDRRHNQASARDYSGVIGRLAATYAITGKLGLQLSGERQIYEETYADRIYSITSSFGIGLAYEITDRIKAIFFNKLKWKDYRDIPGSNVGTRSDFLDQMDIGLEWSPLNRLTVGLGYRYLTRSSNEEVSNFDDHSVMAKVGYKF